MLNVLVVSVEELVDGRSQDQLLYDDVLLVDQCRPQSLEHEIVGKLSLCLLHAGLGLEGWGLLR